MTNEKQRVKNLYRPGLKLVFLGGKGGVGKTSLSCALALELARTYPQKTFRLISVDPAHSLRDCLLDSVLPKNLTLDEFDSAEAMDRFLLSHSDSLSVIAKRGTFLDDEDISRLMDLSLPGMDELFAFLEIGLQAEDENIDTIIIDSAPTGHALRLLSLPSFNSKWLQALDAMLGKHRYMKQVFSGSYTPDGVDNFLVELNRRNEKLLHLLRDHTACSFIPVFLAEKVSIDETLKLLVHLEELEIQVNHVVANRLYLGEVDCDFCQTVYRRQQQWIEALQKKRPKLVVMAAPCMAIEPQGAEQLKEFAETVVSFSSEDSARRDSLSRSAPVGFMDPVNINNEENKLKLSGKKLLIFGGKGGVGKTTMAAAAALALSDNNAAEGQCILSSDPAHSLADCFDMAFDGGGKATSIAPKLSGLELDAASKWNNLKADYDSELAAYLSSLSDNLDFTFDKEVMERLLDLSPPGIDEIMAITEAVGQLHGGKNMIIDSAPTGHLIRLLQAPELLDDWLKAIFELFLKYKTVMHLPRLTKYLVDISKKLKKFRSLITDHNKAGIVVVSIPTEMALAECRDLLKGCEEMDLSVSGLIINMLSGHAHCSRGEKIQEQEAKVCQKYAVEFAHIPQQLLSLGQPPVGRESLSTLGRALFY